MIDRAICILAGISFVKFKRLCCDEHSNACISKVERRNVGIEIHEEKQTAADVAGVTRGKKKQSTKSDGSGVVNFIGFIRPFAVVRKHLALSR